MATRSPLLPDDSEDKRQQEKHETKLRKTLAQTLKGMKVENWEIRENSEGRRVVYVRFVEKEPETTVKVEGA